jgi:ferredoxin-thioredoxin reductase catalytic subunit
MAAQAAADHGIQLEVVKHTEAKRGFVLLPRRWVVERSVSVRSKVKHHIALVLMFLAATFAVGRKLPSADAPEPFHLFLNDSVGITLAMNRDALPKSTPARELRCASSDIYGHTYCELLVNDEVIIAGARVLSAEFMLDENRVTNIIFYLNTSHMGSCRLLLGLRSNSERNLGQPICPCYAGTIKFPA